MARDDRPRIGAHVSPEHPLKEAESLGVDCVQIFCGPPQSFKKPPPRDDAEELKASDVDVYVHAPYRLNVCHPNNRVRIPSRKTLADTVDRAAEIGAAGVIVHAGYAEDALEKGFERWWKVFDEREFPVPILIENTAGGDNAVARHIDTIGRLWETVGSMGAGFCFDTCHAHAAGEDLSDAVERVLEITGRIDLVHVNDSRDAAGSGADRHTNLGAGEMDPEALRHMIRAAKASAYIVETPGDHSDVAADVAFVRDALEGG